MKKELIIRKAILILLFFIAFFDKTYAQDAIVLGSHVKSGKGNTNITVVKGGGVGTKIKAGKKSIKVETLEVNLLENHPDSLKFYVRLFPMHNNTLESNIMPDKIYSQSIKNNKINIDLKDFNLVVSGNFLIGLEWVESTEGYNNKIYFPSGLFKKGIYFRDEDDGLWKKMPLFGLDMELHGTVLIAAK